MTVYPIAKINLGLNVIERRADGYHNLETVFFPITGINDELSVEIADEHDTGCDLTVKGVEELCPPEKNLVVKAYNLLAENYRLPRVKATLVKHLPSQAGMGGGSSDGAYMIKALDELCKLGMTIEEMQRVAARLGADCPFFITAQTSYATGIGEILTPFCIEQLSGMYIALEKPNVAVSTKEAYAGITPRRPKVNCSEALQMPIETWKDNLVNDFEESIFPKLPVLKEVKERMYRDGAVYVAMSGSGSTIYGIFREKPDGYSTVYRL